MLPKQNSGVPSLPRWRQYLCSDPASIYFFSDVASLGLKFEDTKVGGILEHFSPPPPLLAQVLIDE